MQTRFNVVDDQCVTRLRKPMSCSITVGISTHPSVFVPQESKYDPVCLERVVSTYRISCKSPSTGIETEWGEFETEIGCNIRSRWRRHNFRPLLSSPRRTSGIRPFNHMFLCSRVSTTKTAIASTDA